MRGFPLERAARRSSTTGKETGAARPWALALVLVLALCVGWLLSEPWSDGASNESGGTPTQGQDPAAEGAISGPAHEPVHEPSREPIRPRDPEPETAAAPGPRGTVIEADGERPVEGLTVQMRFGKRILAEAVTDAAGAFSLPRPERNRRTVQVVTDGWRFQPHKIRLDEDQTQGAVPLSFRAVRIVAQPLRLRIVDRHSADPVPEFLIRAEGPRENAEAPPLRVESATTDADGRLATEGAFEGGMITLGLVDHPSYPGSGSPFRSKERTALHSHRVDAQGPAEVEVPIDVGPTYPLEITLPEGSSPGDFYATFPRPPTGSADMHRAVAGDPGSPFALFYGSTLTPGAADPKAPLREGDPIWTRFRDPIDHRPEERAGPFPILVKSLDGLWAGEARVTERVGVYPERVPIELTARGRIDGIVVDKRGKPVPTAWISVAAAAGPDTLPQAVGADAEGRFRFLWLPQGDHEVVVETARFEESRTRVRVTPGVTESVTIELSSAVPLGPVSGVLRSRTGAHRSKGGMLLLQSLDDPDFSLFKSATYRRRDGEYVAPFAFENVPHGAYELTLEPLDNQYWPVRTLRVSPPAEGLEFVCEDDRPTFDLAFRVVDAETGKPIAKSWNIVWQGASGDVRLDDDWETGIYRGVPEGIALSWALRASGYRMATGDEDDIPNAGEPRTVEVRLERGWAHIYKVTTRDQDPLEGVVLFVDGDRIGETDERGLVTVQRETKPTDVDFRYGDWVVTWGIDPAEGRIGSGLESPVYMGPKP